ncbi:protein of unknown function [Paraburkholderia kururiensis]
MPGRLILRDFSREISIYGVVVYRQSCIVPIRDNSVKNGLLISGSCSRIVSGRFASLFGSGTAGGALARLYRHMTEET